MPKKTGIAIVAMGAVLILSALLLLFHNRSEDAHAGQEAESLLAGVEAAISAQATDAPDIATPDSTEATATPDRAEATAAPSPTPLDPEMPVVMLDGYEYVGYIEIPALGLKLPVMSEWDYTRLKIAPCRQFGSSRTDDLVIAAHNYESHFGRLKDLSVGDIVTFTDMEGIVNTYSAEKIETLNPNEVDAVQNSGYDLVLYTCTKGGKTRVTVFCNRVDDVEESTPSPIPEGE